MLWGSATGGGGEGKVYVENLGSHFINTSSLCLILENFNTNLLVIRLNEWVLLNDFL